jgi:hypothetical protein
MTSLGRKNFRITNTESVARGKIYHVAVEDKSVKILVTNHAEERINRWNLDVKMVFETLLYPEDVLVGHRGRFIAHKRYGMHLVRAIYESVLVTVYYPSIKRYFKDGEYYADKILP